MSMARTNPPQLPILPSAADGVDAGGNNPKPEDGKAEFIMIYIGTLMKILSNDTSCIIFFVRELTKAK